MMGRKEPHPVCPATYWATLALGSLLVSGLSCARVNPEHCAIQGGDFDCEATEICIIPVVPSSDDGVDAPNGCYAGADRPRIEIELSDAPQGYNRVPFGIPAHFETTSTSDRHSVAGIIAFALSERGTPDCPLDLGALRPAWELLAEQVRDVLDQRARIRPSSVALDRDRLEVLRDFNARVLDQLGECVAPLDTGAGAGTGTGTSDMSTEDTGSDDSGTTSTTGPAPCTTNEDCTNELAPYCDPFTSECVSCDQALNIAADIVCASIDPHAPLCVNGECVACTEDDTTACDDQLLLCNAQTMACDPCAKHSDCESGACDLLLDVPTCFESDSSIRFSVGKDRSYPTIGEALSASAHADRAILVLYEPDKSEFSEAITIISRSVAFMAADEVTPLWSAPNNPALDTLRVFGSDSRVYLDGVSLSHNEERGLLCANGASVDIRRSRVTSNYTGGIRAQSGCHLNIENSFIGANASDETDAIQLDDSSLEMLYTTVAAGTGQDAYALNCAGTSTAYARNSIMVSEDSGETNCNSLVYENSATNSTQGIGNWDDNWFENFSNGDLHLKQGDMGHGASVFAGIAIWRSGDPEFDIDGEPRADIDGTPEHVGADIP